MPTLTSALMLSVLAQAPVPTKAVPATTSTKEMYGFWCTPDRVSSMLCKHHDLVVQMGTTSDPTEKKAISEKIRAVLKPATPPTPGAPRTPSPFSKEYQEMKMAYCASNPAGGKILCSTAASQFKTGGASSLRPTSSTSPTTLSSNEVWTWYCAKEGQDAEQQKMCANHKARADVLEQLRKPGVSMDDRKKLTEQLKLAPSVAYATTQALYSDFCKVAANAQKLTCSRLKQTQASVSMRKWYCEQPANGESNWCKRSQILEKLQKLPASSTDSSAVEERKSLTAEYAKFSRPPAGGGPSISSQIAKEIVAAKKYYCAVETNKQIPYCKTPTVGSPMGSTLAKRMLGRSPAAQRK